MNLATWSIRNPIPTILLFFFLALAGTWGFQNVLIQSLPDLDLPTVNIVLDQPGASPVQLETDVARKVEGAISSLVGLKNLRTSITDGKVTMIAEFKTGTDHSDAINDVKDAIDRIRNQLPADLENPQISKSILSPDGALGVYALAHETMDEEALSWFVDDTIEQAVINLSGIGKFERLGGVQREIQVTIDPILATALGVTASDISKALRRAHQDSSGGQANLADQEQGVRTLANVEHPDDLNALPITLPNGSFLRLDQVATVEDTIAERTQVTRLNGKPVVGFRVFRTKGSNEMKTAASLDNVMDELRQKHPKLTIELISTSTDTTKEEYRGSMTMLLEGAILSILVIWWFLRDWRTTIIGAVALPLSILPTFAVIYLMDYSLNTLTLLALAVVVGILVDDAVVEVENIARHMQMGKSAHDATVEAVNEIAIAVLGTTATLVAVFLPTALMGGIPGMLFKQFGWTIVTAVLASLLVARMVTPVMAIWLLKTPAKNQHTEDGPIMVNYMRCVKWCIHHRKTTLAAGLIFFVGSIALIPLIPSSFLPPEDYGLISVNMELAPGSNLERSLTTADAVYNILKDVEGIESIFTTIGGSETGETAGEVRKGIITLVLLPREQRKTQLELQQIVRKKIEGVPGVRLNIITDLPGESLEVILASNDSKNLISSAHAIEKDLRSLSFLSGITSSATLERSEITLRPRTAAAAEQGITAGEIGETLRIALAGDFEHSLAKINLDRRQLNIRVQMPKDFSSDLEAIKQLQIHGRNGLIPISSIADITIESAPSQIDRFNRQRQVTINAGLDGFPIGKAMEARNNLPSVLGLPSGVEMIESGDTEMINEMASNFLVAIVVGLLLTYSILVMLFRSWLQPITILSAIPLSMGGAFIAILLGGHSMGLPVMIGLIMLMGIVTKNSILLVDFALVAEREYKLYLMDAISDACHKRARPILMTTVAMLAGLTPLALGFVGGNSFREPMAIAVMGGLITSTGLSLLVVPVVYIYIRRLQEWLSPQARKTYQQKVL